VKQLKHPATFIAAVALFMALGGGAMAYAAVVINGAQIKNHTISAKKLTNAAVTQLKGHPGGKLVTFDATATSPTPTATPLGTFLGMTISAACSTNSGDATLILNISTPTGAWTTDLASISGTGSAGAGYLSVPAGTISSPTPLTLNAASGGTTESDWLDFYQLYPGTGEMVWNLTATTSTSTSCHFSLQYFPDTITTMTAAKRAPAAKPTTLPSLRHTLGLGGLG